MVGWFVLGLGFFFGGGGLGGVFFDGGIGKEVRQSIGLIPTEEKKKKQVLQFVLLSMCN